MLRLSYKTLSFLFLLLRLSQCVYYTPNAHYVPLLRNKGDLRLMGGFQSGLEDNMGVDFQTAYAHRLRGYHAQRKLFLGKQFLR